MLVDQLRLIPHEPVATNAFYEQQLLIGSVSLSRVNGPCGLDACPH